MRAGGFANKLRFTLAVVLTLLTLGICVLWVGSYSRHFEDLYPVPLMKERSAPRGGLHPSMYPDYIEIHGWAWSFGFNDTECVGLRAEDGRIVIQIQSESSTNPVLPYLERSWFGFGYTEVVFDPRYDEIEGDVPILSRIVMIPFWALLLLVAACPTWLWWIGLLRRRRRRKLGQCLACGYDLAHSPGRCPECGAEAKAVG